MRSGSVNPEPRRPMAVREPPLATRGKRMLRQGATIAALCSLLVAHHGMPSAQAQAPAAEPLAEVNGVAITAKDVERALGAKLSQLEEQIYTLKRTEIDALVAQSLLAQEAAKRGVTVAALLDEEVTSKVGLVTETEIDDYYKANKARMRGDEATVRPQIRTFLQQQKLAVRRGIYLASLRSQAKIVVRLEPPATARVDVAVGDAPVRGAPDAAVTIIEFSDFECPFCKRANVTTAKIMERYAGKVRLAYRDFPLENIHPLARGAAEAARCARDGGKFWEFHDVLFVQSPKLAPDDLKRYAREIALDGEKFDACLAGGMHKAAVQKDIDEATRLGLTGTPAFFINGRLLSGAQPVEAFARMIDDELARTTRVSAKAK